MVDAVVILHARELDSQFPCVKNDYGTYVTGQPGCCHDVVDSYSTIYGHVYSMTMARLSSDVNAMAILYTRESDTLLYYLCQTYGMVTAMLSTEIVYLRVVTTATTLGQWFKQLKIGMSNSRLTRSTVKACLRNGYVTAI